MDKSSSYGRVDQATNGRPESPTAGEGQTSSRPARSGSGGKRRTSPAAARVRMPDAGEKTDQELDEEALARMDDEGSVAGWLTRKRVDGDDSGVRPSRPRSTSFAGATGWSS
jgi:hypothetical protein